MADTSGQTPNVTPLHGQSFESAQGATGSYGGGGGGSGTVHIPMKEYVDAQDQKTRAQNDARFAEVLSELKGISSSLSAHGEIVKERLNSLDQDVKLVKAAADEASSAAKSLKWNILTTGIAVVGVLFAAWALWAQGVEMTTGILGSQNGQP